MEVCVCVRVCVLGLWGTAMLCYAHHFEVGRTVAHGTLKKTNLATLQQAVACCKVRELSIWHSHSSIQPSISVCPSIGFGDSVYIWFKPPVSDRVQTVGASGVNGKVVPQGS